MIERYAAVGPDGTVESVVLADADFAKAHSLILAPTASPGDRWDGSTFAVDAARQPQMPTRQQLDELRYQRRAASKDSLIAWMAADNMARVRSGVWTVSDLTTLLDALAPINAMMQTLSFELAAQVIAASTHQLMTADIKAAWVTKLQAHFYT